MVKTTLVHTLFLVLTLAGIAGYYAVKPLTQKIAPDVLETTARVLTVDNEEVRSSGLSHIGHQELTVEILKGRYQGNTLTAFNSLVGQTDLENLFEPGDVIIAAIILGASGACMDIAMDIAAAMDEIKKKKPDIPPLELIQSGFVVGRHVIGTMATTLLLAYSGGYLTLLMLFQVKEPGILRMLNLKIVAAEIMRTLVGSIGLVLVAPITAIVGGIIIGGLMRRKRQV